MFKKLFVTFSNKKLNINNNKDMHEKVEFNKIDVVMLG